jgi:hypothetical protein
MAGPATEQVIGAGNDYDGDNEVGQALRPK